jgi:hypothetical protein
MSSKGILDRHRIAKAIVAAARMHAEQVGGRMQEVFASAVEEGETSPDFVTFLRQLARFLETRIAEIIAAEKLHFNELDDDDEPRLRRDQAAQVLHDTMVAIRDSLTGAFGAERAAKILGIEGKTAVDPLALLHQADLALERLNAESPELPPRRLDGVELDLGALAAQLQPALDELGQAVREVDEQARLREATLLERDLALDAFDTAVGSVGRILIAFDRLAGFGRLGSRIRLTLPVRRRRGTAPDEGSPLPDGGEETPPAEDGAPSGVPLSDLLTGLPEASDI